MTDATQTNWHSPALIAYLEKLAVNQKGDVKNDNRSASGAAG